VGRSGTNEITHLITEVREQLVDGKHYRLLTKGGSDGQTGRGRNAKKGKKVDDNKR
jgi:hypothetical protein